MRKLILLAVALIGLNASLLPSANAIVVSVGVNDRPYYVHGPGYWNGPTYYYWVPGRYVWHRHHRVWMHGYYVRRY